MIFDCANLTTELAYQLITQTVLPRPVAWILTQNNKGAGLNYNLAPFSYFAPVCSEPPVVMVSLAGKADGEMKDTLRNVIQTQSMVVHIANVAQAGKVTATSAPLLYGESEVSHQGLSLVAFPGAPLPRLKDAPVALYCELMEIKGIGHQAQNLIFAEVKQMFIDDSVLSRQGERWIVDALKLDPLSRLGGNDYGQLGNIINIPRPQ